MKNWIAYLETSGAELRRLIDEAEAERKRFPQWLVDAQLNAIAINSVIKQHD